MLAYTIFLRISSPFFINLSNFSHLYAIFMCIVYTKWDISILSHIYLPGNFTKNDYIQARYTTKGGVIGQKKSAVIQECCGCMKSIGSRKSESCPESG